MTWLKFINVFFFQWFFIRLTKCSKKIIKNYKIMSFDMMPNGNFGSRGTGTTETKTWYSIQGFIVPCTGWRNNFKFVNKEPKFWKITKEKTIK